MKFMNLSSLVKDRHLIYPQPHGTAVAYRKAIINKAVLYRAAKFISRNPDSIEMQHILEKVQNAGVFTQMRVDRPSKGRC